MWAILLLPFILQATLIGIDEIYFHYKRGLPKWERIGHPLDTMSYVLCLMIILFCPYTPHFQNFYYIAAILSCLLVTKDEFIHKHHCDWAENWVHALLFILHPVVLIIAYLFWPALHGELIEWPWIIQADAQILKIIFSIQTALVCCFCIYQIVFWNFIWKETPVLKK